jgi:hypothetical protein
MRTIGVIGDTQGAYHLANLLATVESKFQGVDEIWHAGDWQNPEVLSGLAKLATLTVVNGNAPDDNRYPGQVRLRIESLEIGMVHRPPGPADPWAAQLDICIHGHTHRWRDEVVGRTRFINVATPTAPGPNQPRTIGILTIDGSRADLLKVVL